MWPTTVAERERVRSALLAAGYNCPATATNFVFVRSAERLGEQLERRGLVVRIFANGIRITIRGAARE